MSLFFVAVVNNQRMLLQFPVLRHASVETKPRRRHEKPCPISLETRQYLETLALAAATRCFFAIEKFRVWIYNQFGFAGHVAVMESWDTCLFSRRFGRWFVMSQSLLSFVNCRSCLGSVSNFYVSSWLTLIEKVCAWDNMQICKHSHSIMPLFE